MLSHYKKETEKADEKYDLIRLMSKRVQNPMAASTISVNLDERASYKTIVEEP